MQASPSQRRARLRRPGFTIIELLVVIAIIAVLAGLLMPALAAALNKAHESVTMNRIHQCEVALQAFFNDHGDYPPTHWYELDELFEYDADGDGIQDDVWVSPTGSTPPGIQPDLNTDPSTVNQGIEVVAACIASRNGGPYLDFDESWLRNADATDGTLSPADGEPDGDQDVAIVGPGPDVAACTNWYFGGDALFEIVDFWGNPLVYIHNRDYRTYDGVDDTGNIDTGEAMIYADIEGDRGPVFSRSTAGFMTQNYPNLNSFQLFSWGLDELPGCVESTTSPGTPNPNEPGVYPGWTAASGNLTNWEE